MFGEAARDPPLGLYPCLMLCVLFWVILRADLSVFACIVGFTMFFAMR